MNACNPEEYTIPGFDSIQAALAPQRQSTLLLLAPVEGKTVEIDFDGGRLSSDAGLILLSNSQSAGGFILLIPTVTPTKWAWRHLGNSARGSSIAHTGGMD